MKRGIILFMMMVLFLFSANEPIKSVGIGRNREILINGKPFFPIMIFSQSEEKISECISLGINTFFGNGGKISDIQYLEKLKEKNVYGILKFSSELINHSNLIGWFIEDEPDAKLSVYEVRVVPGKGLIVNPRTPFSRIIDGDVFSWT
ncbi:MAG: hypothetical protein NZ891_08975, partial [bacterium]|nr:hypothetical protein [bacterium]MDW8164853.1 hypothetical protein [Candidatus Omnitrophota bacterium]